MIADADGYGPADVAHALRIDPRALEPLNDFRALLLDANSQMNLVGPSASSEFWRRHVLDSAQLLRLAPDATVWADIGAGAGFPGVVLAILLRSREEATVHLVESHQKRCRFLQSVVDTLQLPAKVHWARAESMAPPQVQLVTARACAPLARLLGYAFPFTRQGAPCLFLKGRSVQDEVAQARKTWRFRAEAFPSLSAPEGHILRVEGLARG